jgi:hypothetical protein
LSGNPFLWLEKLGKKDWEPFEFAQDKLQVEKLPKIKINPKIARFTDKL